MVDRTRHSMPRSPHLSWVALLVALGGCASTTTVQLDPSPQAAVCGSATEALVLWVTQWRADQKDVLAREAAAGEGIGQFFERSGCFRSAAIQRLPQNARQSTQAAVAEAAARYEKVVLIAVRELGPTVRIGASLALVEGGTEVVLDVAEYSRARPAPRTFTVRWRSGGPGVLRGVATLPQDLQAALGAALQPPAR